MIKQWRPVLEDINHEIIRINASIADAQFNSDFSHKMHVIKLRTNELAERIRSLIGEMRSEAAAERNSVDMMMAEFYAEVRELNATINASRQFRAGRSRANWLHVQKLKAAAAAEKEGGEA